ncbi:hypothetical protein [Sphingobium sp.]|uniref:hypothetical protein n=1 Tax=Sphingobium sp. TaxID=1912891 RepID=UPI003BB695E3
MAPSNIIDAPAGFVPELAVAFKSPDGTATLVTQTSPLPIAVAALASAQSTPLSGSSATSSSFGPFTPQLGRAIWLTLSGVWAGTVQLLRSTNGGVTRLPLTFADGSVKAIATTNINAPVAEETVQGATYYLSATLSSGTLAYRVEQ